MRQGRASGLVEISRLPDVAAVAVFSGVAAEGTDLILMMAERRIAPEETLPRVGPASRRVRHTNPAWRTPTSCSLSSTRPDELAAFVIARETGAETGCLVEIVAYANLDWTRPADLDGSSPRAYTRGNSEGKGIMATITGSFSARAPSRATGPSRSSGTTRRMSTVLGYFAYAKPPSPGSPGHDHGRGRHRRGPAPGHADRRRACGRARRDRHQELPQHSARLRAVPELDHGRAAGSANGPADTPGSVRQFELP